MTTPTDTSTNRILRMADDMHRFGATPSRARKVVNVLRALAAERDEIRAESVNYADALAAQNNIIDGLMAENARMRKSLANACDLLGDLRDTEWEEDEPNSRGDLPEPWQLYVSEMEAFANYWVGRARAFLANLEKTDGCSCETPARVGLPWVERLR